MSEEKALSDFGKIFVVATPIGNLGDITQRALDTLKGSDIIAAEDTRRTQTLLSHFGISVKLISLYEHNEDEKSPQIIKMVKEGKNISLVSDAGTPLISDPGFGLIRLAVNSGVKVVPIPGACSPIVALSVSGLATDRFVFEGFLPAKNGARVKYLENLKTEPRTMIFFESSHRIVSSIESMIEVFGEERKAVVARELTKTYETVFHASLKEIFQFVNGDNNQQKGEFVVVVDGGEAESSLEIETSKVLKILLDEGLPTKQVASIAAKITGEKKKELYSLALEIKSS